MPSSGQANFEVSVIGSPAHPYTAALLTSTVLGSQFGKRLEAIAGMPPDLRALPDGCSFEPRCRFADERCRGGVPPPFAHAPAHMTRCLRVAAREMALPAPNLGERKAQPSMQSTGGGQQ